LIVASSSRHLDQPDKTERVLDEWQESDIDGRPGIIIDSRWNGPLTITTTSCGPTSTSIHNPADVTQHRTAEQDKHGEDTLIDLSFGSEYDDTTMVKRTGNFGSLAKVAKAVMPKLKKFGGTTAKGFGQVANVGMGLSGIMMVKDLVKPAKLRPEATVSPAAVQRRYFDEDERIERRWNSPPRLKKFGSALSKGGGHFGTFGMVMSTMGMFKEMASVSKHKDAKALNTVKTITPEPKHAVNSNSKEAVAQKQSLTNEPKSTEASSNGIDPHASRRSLANDDETDHGLTKRGAGVMAAASGTVGVLMLLNMGTTMGGKVLNHIVPHGGDDGSGQVGIQGRSVTQWQGYEDGTSMMKRQQDEEEHAISNKRESQKEDKLDESSYEASFSKRNNVMNVAGHALTAGFAFQTGNELLPGMWHETIRVGGKTKHWIQEHLRHSGGAQTVQQGSADLSSPNRYPQLLRRDFTTNPIERDTSESELILRRGITIPPHVQSVLQKSLAVAGAGVTWTMLASVIDGPLNYITKTIKTTNNRSSGPPPSRRSLSEEGKEGRLLNLEREIASDIVICLITRKAPGFATSDQNKVTTDRKFKDAFSDDLIQEHHDDNDNYDNNNECRLLLPRAMKIDMKSIGPKALHYASQAVTVTMLASLVDPLLQRFTKTVSPIRSKVQRRSLLDDGSASLPPFLLLLGDDSPPSTSTVDFEVNFEKRKSAFNRFVNKVTRSKVFKGIKEVGLAAAS